MIRTREKINRQEKILLSLAELTYSTSKQLQTIMQLGSNRNARRILYELEQDGLIKSIRYGKKIYYVTNKGNDSIGRGNTRLNRSEVQHCLMRNDLYIKLGTPATWKKEAAIMINKKPFIISDARFKRNNKYYFVEVDHKQSMRNNTEKIKKYKEVFTSIYRQEGYHPQLIWYTLSDARKKRLEKECIKEQVNYKIY